MQFILPNTTSQTCPQPSGNKQQVNATSTAGPRRAEPRRVFSSLSDAAGWRHRIPLAAGSREEEVVKPSSRTAHCHTTLVKHSRESATRRGTGRDLSPTTAVEASLCYRSVGACRALTGDSWGKRGLAALPAALRSLGFSPFCPLVCTPGIPNGYRVGSSTRTASPTQPQCRRGNMVLTITLDLQRRKGGGCHLECVRGQARRPRAGLGFHALACFQSGAAA